MRNGLRKICAVAAVMLLSTSAFSSTAFAEWETHNGKTYYDDFLSSLHELPSYETAFVPVKLSESSDFSNDLVNCVNINGELYHISLEYIEKYSGWNDIKEDITDILGSDDLPIDNYKELRNMSAFGICVDENDRNPNPLYRISDDIVILEDFHCKYDKNGKLYHMTTNDELIGYRICSRLSSEVLYKNCWYESDGFKYYIGSNSLPTTKNRTINGIRYVFNKYGQCQGKYTGWSKSANGRRYYKNGVMLKERWIKTKSGKKYYAGEDGYMRTGWARVDGKTCFFDEKGVWDGKKYYKGYKPVSMKYFLMDFDFSDDIEYEYCINYKKYYDFEGIDVVREILEAEKDRKFIYDNSSDDETELNEGIYHGGKQIIIRCATDTKAADKTPHIIFTKDKDGNSYFYCSQYGFGYKLSDSGAYDKIAELIS